MNRSEKETAAIESAKEALYAMAPYFSVLGEKLAVLEESLRQLTPDQVSVPDAPEIDNFMVLNNAFAHQVKKVGEHSQTQLEASHALTALLEKGMKRKNVVPSRREFKAYERGSLNASEGVLPTLYALDEMISDQSRTARDVHRHLDDCIDYVENQFMPAFERLEVAERVGPLLNAKKNSWRANGVLTLGLALISYGGFLANTDRIDTVGTPEGAALGGLLVTGGSVALHKRSKKQSQPSETASSDPISR